MDRYEAKLEQIESVITEVKQTVDGLADRKSQERQIAAKRPLVVIGRHSAHEIAWWTYSIVGGIFLALSPSSSENMRLLEPWQLYGWALMFVVSGIVGLWSTLDRRNLARSLGFEQGAWLVNAAALLTFAAVLISLVPIQRVWFTVGMCSIWVVANLYRALWQIRKEFASLHWGPR